MRSLDANETSASLLDVIEAKAVPYAGLPDNEQDIGSHGSQGRAGAFFMCKV
jgi:hypothetical protein